jgi:hypothetical protein
VPGLMRRLALIFTVSLAAMPAMSGASAVATTRAGPAASSSWKLRPSPNVTLPGGQIDSVSCSSAHACTAVGTNLNTSGLNVTLAERWNGVSWQRQATPNPPGDTTASDSPVLLGVSCAVAHFCEAVGTSTKNNTETILADVWRGRAWTSQAVPTPPGTTSAGLNAVSCSSATSCEAVGFYVDNSGEWILADRWNGTSWHLQSVPRQSGSTLNRLVGISCAAATSCEAVGSSHDGSGNAAGLAASWNGVSWQLQTMPDPMLPDSVSCTSPTFCEAVGPAAAATWNGTSWQSQSFPVPNGASIVNVGGVSCVSAVSCEAVGSYQVTPCCNYVALAASWDGNSWTLQATPSPARAMFAGLNAVSCVTAGACEAGGYFELERTGSFVGPTVRGLAEIWNGSSWQHQRIVQPASATSNSLGAVSCVSANRCEAVGSHLGGSGSLIGLAEAWNGARWRIQKTPDPSHELNAIHLSLNAVSCVAARFCIAAGESSANPQPVETEMWNGSSWQPQPFPRPIPLTSVSCTSVDFCMAVGERFAFSWNGTSWSVLPTSPSFEFSSVSCASMRFCEATGVDSVTGDRAEVWKGSSWSLQPTPTPAGAVGITLSSVFCWRLDHCEAVGHYTTRVGKAVPLAEVRVATKWVVQRTPNPKGSLNSSLLGVSCSSATFCAAVGSYSTSTGTFMLALTWNGTAWSRRATTKTPRGFDSLNGVSCTPKGSCTAVGTVSDNSRGFASTLVEVGGSS